MKHKRLSGLLALLMCSVLMACCAGTVAIDDYADNDATEDDSDSGDIIADKGNFPITDNPDGDLDDPTNM